MEVTNSVHGGREENQAVTFFNNGANDYVDFAINQPGFVERFSLFERQIEMARQHLGAEAVCMDLGCGPGTLALKARGYGFQVIGVDGSSSMLEYASSSAEQLGLDVDFRQAQLPLDQTLLKQMEGSVDLLIASSVIEYISDDTAFAMQCRRLLSPRGIALISFANGRSIYRAVERQLTRTSILKSSYMTVQHKQYSVDGASKLFNQAELYTKSVYYFGMPAWLYRIWRSPGRPPWLATLFLLVLGGSPMPKDDESSVS
jgi:2-polyprenyl-3-methyl-5-hydroxy-6-metoxy-1,4-benzoquinol methylase